MLAVPLFLLSLLCSSSFMPSPALADSDYLSRLIEEVRQRKLYDDEYWWILLHYKKDPFGVRSLIDDPAFFLSPEGKHDPQAEMEATVRAFFQEPEDNSPPIICRFIAGFTWLKQELPLDPVTLPLCTCEEFDQTIAQLKPASATVAFPTYYMNSPASMFGHTLIIINSENQSALIANTINYAAVTNETFGPLFVVKGLFGLYKGYYSFLPYYQKIQQYSDISQRDIWEYSLTLNETENLRMIRHL